MKSSWGFACLVSILLLAWSDAAAQRVYRIGALVADDQFVPAIDGFKQRMKELGYIEGKNIDYDFENSKGDQDLLAKMAEGLVQRKPDLIVTSSTTASVPIAKLTKGTDLPVVFLSAGDPLRLVKSYASSGNNLTGISSSSVDLTAKRMELLKKIAPQVKRVIILIDTAALGINHERLTTDAQEAAKKLDLDHVRLAIHTKNSEEMKQKIPLIKRSLGDALFVPPVATIVASTEDIARQVIKEKMPHVGPNVETVNRGLVAAYSSNYHSLGQQGAVLVDKILKGAKPSDLPIEQPFKLHLRLNIKTARAIGLKIPREILIQADEVIK
ncbi:MAG TPA: ABC transporter substrate-binding protein [Candidatus Binatia bacterium]|nr:ABC transporter substrate-binding protein [Candidatus Binatia bacterium]